MPFDYIIVGAGSAGCVLAERLSASGRRNVLLVEAGPADRHPLIHMPRGMAKLFSDPRHVWLLPTIAEGDTPAETWIRGKVLGGSSSVNGMMYFRGHPEDYDEWVLRGACGWGWDPMLRAFRAIENSTGGEAPLHIGFAGERTALSEALIQGGEALGIPRVADLNHPSQEGVGYATHTIHRGRRQSAADAFLRPARSRRNLHIETGLLVDRVLFDGKRAVAIIGHRKGAALEFRTQGEVILAAGALQSPQLLERSGIGAGARLRDLGIRVIQDSPGVGENLLEHRLLMMQYELLAPLSQNLQFRGWRLALNAARYALTRTGPLSTGTYDVGAFVKTLPNLARPDAEILMAPYSLGFTHKGAVTTDSTHSMHMFGYPLRSRSRGSVHIRSSRPSEGALIRPNYLSDPYDHARHVSSDAALGAASLPAEDHRRGDAARPECRGRCIDPARVPRARHCRLPRLRHCSNGRSGRGRRSEFMRARCLGAARRGRIDHAEHGIGKHQWPHHGDRLAGGRAHSGTGEPQCPIACSTLE
jgi:choline dehydrogenase